MDYSTNGAVPIVCPYNKKKKKEEEEEERKEMWTLSQNLLKLKSENS